MTNNESFTNADELRRKAEERASENAAKVPENQKPMSSKEIEVVLHELRVHEIELEMQNEELRWVRVELETTQAEYFDLYDLAPVGYCTISEEGLLLKANMTAASLLGVVRGWLTGRRLSPFIHEEDQNMYYQQRQQLLATGEPQVCQVRMLKSDGTTFWAQLVATLVREASSVGLKQDGGGGGRVCRLVLSDISALKEAEEERVKLEARLRQAQKMEAVGLLAGGVAHDFNNKMAVILGNAEVIEGKVEPGGEIFDDLQEIRKAAEHSATLTQKLLAFARKQVMMPEMLHLNDTLEDMFKDLRRLTGSGVAFSWLPTAGLWSVKMDPLQVFQILANLCVNAREATAGVGKLTMTTANCVVDEAYCANHPGLVLGEYVLITVTDTGCGMDKETQAKVFEPFFTTKAFGKGAGLGLAMVYGIVKQNNGFIDIVSQPGTGTTFTIYLPRHNDKNSNF